MERFVGKIAVVTGSSSGIGRAIVIELVKKGLIVVGIARNVEKQQVRAVQLNRITEKIQDLTTEITYVLVYTSYDY